MVMLSVHCFLFSIFSVFFLQHIFLQFPGEHCDITRNKILQALFLVHGEAVEAVATTFSQDVLAILQQIPVFRSFDVGFLNELAKYAVEKIATEGQQVGRWCASKSATDQQPMLTHDAIVLVMSGSTRYFQMSA